MVFQSYHFLLFFVVVFFTARCLLENRPGFKKSFLLLASYYFYMCWDWRFAGLLIAITVINYYLGPKIQHAETSKAKKGWLAISIVSSLAILAYFKYFNFFIEGMDTVLSSLGLEGETPYLNILLPLGISFYTFQSVSYTLDIYKGRTSPVNNFRDFALFVSFFPQLVAGPIVRASYFLPQLSDDNQRAKPSIQDGLALIIKGFVKKIAIADVLALHIVDPAFNSAESYSSTFLLLALYAYSFQVYMDFSGYTDIARGISKTLGYELQINFIRPYKAVSVSNFWQRWHISMSSFFKDYLYFGLGGSKRGNVYFNLMITFVMIGVWHGAGINFVLYGLLHGSFVCIERLIRKRREASGVAQPEYIGSRYIFQIFWIFNLIAFSRLLFRGGSWEGAVEYASALTTFENSYMPLSTMGLVAFIAAVVAHYVPDSWTIGWKTIYKNTPVFVQGGGISAAILILMVLSTGDAPFVYFQF